jgi:precorrin isomerase
LESGDDIVVVGSAASALLEAAAVREKVGVDEAAVVIPKSLLLEAMKAAS